MLEVQGQLPVFASTNINLSLSWLTLEQTFVVFHSSGGYRVTCGWCAKCLDFSNRMGRSWSRLTIDRLHVASGPFTDLQNHPSLMLNLDDRM